MKMTSMQLLKEFEALTLKGKNSNIEFALLGTILHDKKSAAGMFSVNGKRLHLIAGLNGLMENILETGEGKDLLERGIVSPLVTHDLAQTEEGEACPGCGEIHDDNDMEDDGENEGEMLDKRLAALSNVLDKIIALKTKKAA